MGRAKQYEEDVWAEVRTLFGDEHLVLRHANRRGRGEGWPQAGRDQIKPGRSRAVWPDVVVVAASAVTGGFRRNRSGKDVRTLDAAEALAAARARPDKVSLALDGDASALPSHRLTLTLARAGVHSLWDAKHYLKGRHKVSRGWSKVGEQMATYVADFQPEAAWIVVPRLDKLPAGRRGDADGVLGDRSDLIKVRWTLREEGGT